MKITDFLGTLFDNPKPVRWVILGFALAFLLATATTCRASEAEWSAGSTVIRGPAAVIKFDIVWPDAGPGDSDYRCGLVLVGRQLSLGDGRNNAGVQCQIRDGFGPIDLGLGVIALQHTDEFNGSNTNFSLSLTWRVTKRLAIEYGHWSNAGTVKPNTGRDMVFVSWRFR